MINIYQRGKVDYRAEKLWENLPIEPKVSSGREPQKCFSLCIQPSPLIRIY